MIQSMYIIKIRNSDLRNKMSLKLGYSQLFNLDKKQNGKNKMLNLRNIRRDG